MLTQRNSKPPLLSVVIIARNEEAHIGQCIESILAAAAAIDCEIVLVDSRSEDRTLEIATAYPIRIIELSGTPRCTPALGRFVGSRITRGRYVQFVDGDTTIAREWLRAGIDALERDPDVAAVGGREDQIYYRGSSMVRTKPDYFGTGDAVTEVKQLGGNGLYRRAVLEDVGSFNPYVRSFEEAELGARIRQAGWRILRDPAVMGWHHTPIPDALEEYWRRFRSHLLTGQGQVLRLSLRQGLFLEHLRQLNRVVLFLLWLAIGLISGLGSLALWNSQPIVTWLIGSALVLAIFAARSRSLSKPFRLTFDWAICSLPFLWGFLLPVGNTQRFDLGRAVAADRGGGRGAVRALAAASAARDARLSPRVSSLDA